jgi:NAD(P)-dependent dehydrogenase (short-subunit alcohol dehydrogenase family)
MNILIVGGSGGIGLAIVKQLLAQQNDHQVFATYNQHDPDFSHPQLQWFKLDLQQPQQVADLANQLPTLDWIINCVGMLHDSEHLPEKSIAAVDSDFFMKNIQLNTLPSLLLIQQLQSKFSKPSQPRFAVLSARIGSIEDNRLGGWYSYRCSKAALNMLVKCVSIEWQRSLPEAAIVAIHPGTTDTALSKPFQKRVAPGSLFNTAKVANCIIDIVQQLTPEQSGRLVDYNNDIIAW